MKIFQDSISPSGIRVWRGRCDGYTVYIKEVMNDELGYVDKYSFVVSKNETHFYFDSTEKGNYYRTVEECKNAAIKVVTEDKQRIAHVKYKI